MAFYRVYVAHGFQILAPDLLNASGVASQIPHNFYYLVSRTSCAAVSEVLDYLAAKCLRRGGPRRALLDLKVSPNTSENYARDLYDFVNFLDSRNRRIEDIEVDDLFDYIDTMYGKKSSVTSHEFASATIQRRLSTMRQFLLWCQKEGRVVSRLECNTPHSCLRAKNLMPSGYHQLNAEERGTIMAMKCDEKSAREIARCLGRSASTITRELRRNDYKAAHEVGRMGRPRIAGGYDAHRAGVRSRRVRRAARRPRKLQEGTLLWAGVRRLLEQGWSPEQIAATLKREHPRQPALQASHETIYTAIYAAPRGDLRRELVKLLRQGRGARRPHSRGTKRRGVLQDIVSIHVRPPEVEERLIPGHWEGDFIKGSRNQSSVGVLVERHSRLVVLAKMESATAEAALTGFTKKLNSIARPMRQTMTYDQGKEMARHAELSEQTGVRVYFCDPHSPWQRGSCENTNGLLRQYLPKGSDLSAHSQQELDAIADLLNTRPRKTLDWRTPLQTFALALTLAEATSKTAQ